MSVDTSLEQLFEELETHSLTCETLWHQDHNIPPEDAVAFLNSLCSSCLVTHHIFIGQRCLNKLNLRKPENYMCLQCRKIGYITYQYTFI